ncbi:hypothetical protein BTIS_1073 [Bifidobacterium tissieri]|uniref:Uncharacterized protein n=1 Tax=Bifidobacterium tissieri TaxID=1630162 RepID=A0A261FFB8_9BIFI|nr:hypothetical protein [Bifidobacterium tissieri]OZG57832.1 hypothetical protein BTIS_1073 [Bifidobacterium tissieri]
MTDWRLVEETPDGMDDDVCPDCGSPLDSLGRCPYWRDRAYDEYGLEP